MKKLNKKELSNIQGGVNITGTFINAILKGINSFLDLGRGVGSAVRRIQSGKLCRI